MTIEEVDLDLVANPDIEDVDDDGRAVSRRVSQLAELLNQVADVQNAGGVSLREVAELFGPTDAAQVATPGQSELERRLGVRFGVYDPGEPDVGAGNLGPSESAARARRQASWEDDFQDESDESSTDEGAIFGRFGLVSEGDDNSSHRPPENPDSQDRTPEELPPQDFEDLMRGLQEEMDRRLREREERRSRTQQPGPDEGDAAHAALAGALLGRFNSPIVDWVTRSPSNALQINPGRDQDPTAAAPAAPPIWVGKADEPRPGYLRTPTGPPPTRREWERRRWGGHGPRPVSSAMAAALARLLGVG